MTIKEKYPNGLNKTIAHFHETLYTIMHNGEIDRVAKHSGIKERLAIRKMKKLIGESEIQRYAIWPILDYLVQCPNLLVDIVAIMAMMNEESYTPEEVEERFTKCIKKIEEAHHEID